MIKGTGMDLVRIERIRRAIDLQDGAFRRRTFSEKECAYAEEGRDPSVRYAGMYAVKEAVFKAVAHGTRHGNFDYRIVETGHHADGSPYVEVRPALQKLLAEAGIRQLHISITDEGDYAAAIAVAED